MKVILTGATGFIGGQVLKDCLSNPAITSIVAISRRELPSDLTRNASKLTVIIHNDFTSYPSHMLEELKGAQACIWALGVKPNLVTTYEETKKIEVDGPVSAATAFLKSLIPALPVAQKFRFLYVSGRLGERDQNKKLWFLQDGRRLKGEVENAVMKLNDEYEAGGKFEGYVVRPAWVTKAKVDENLGMSMLMGSMVTYSSAIRADELAAMMIELATKGSPERKIWENSDMVSRGQELIRKRMEGEKS